MDAKLIIQRKVYNTKPVRNTIGELFLNGSFMAYTLEDEIRANRKKIYGKTAIPAGLYMVKLRQSPKFKKILPIIYNDELTLSIKAGGIEFSGVLLHNGNTEEDSSGCVLIAYNTDKVKIWNGASDYLVKELGKYDKIILEIQNKIFNNGLTNKIEI